MWILQKEASLQKSLRTKLVQQDSFAKVQEAIIQEIARVFPERTETFERTLKRVKTTKKMIKEYLKQVEKD